MTKPPPHLVVANAVQEEHFTVEKNAATNTAPSAPTTATNNNSFTLKRMVKVEKNFDHLTWLLPGERVLQQTEFVGYPKNYLDSSPSPSQKQEAPSLFGFNFGFTSTDPSAIVDAQQVVTGTLYITTFQVRFCYSVTDPEQMKKEQALRMSVDSLSESIINFTTPSSPEKKESSPTGTTDFFVATPLGTISKIEEKYQPDSYDPIYNNCNGFLNIRCKDLQVLTFLFYPHCSNTVNHAYLMLSSMQGPNNMFQLFAYDYKKSQLANKATCFTQQQMEEGWKVYNFEQEFTRQGLGAHDSESWKICNLNRTYHFCDTYPKHFIVPKSITDDKLKAAGLFRSRCRIPVLTWKHPFNGTTITRCSQPMVLLICYLN